MLTLSCISTVPGDGDGWQLRTITAADVKGRIGPGGVDGLLVTFERPVG